MSLWHPSTVPTIAAGHVPLASLNSAHDLRRTCPSGIPQQCPRSPQDMSLWHPSTVPTISAGHAPLASFTDRDPSVLNCPLTNTEDDYPILRREVAAAVQPLKKGKSAGVDNIPAELVQAGGEDIITALTTICNKMWQTGEWPTPWTQSLVITLPKKGNLQQCQNYRTISLISQPSKVMLKIILNRVKPQAEKIIAEEQAGFRAGTSTTEQIFNLRIL